MRRNNCSTSHKKAYVVVNIKPTALGFADGADPKYLPALENILNNSDMVLDSIKFYDHMILRCC